MSFSIYGGPAAPADVREAVEQAFEGSEHASRAAGPYADRVAVVAKSLADLVTREGDQVTFSISGHRNPGNAPVSGWADCGVTVSVTQIPAEKA
jgi:hypothetical protein